MKVHLTRASLSDKLSCCRENVHSIVSFENVLNLILHDGWQPDKSLWKYRPHLQQRCTSVVKETGVSVQCQTCGGLIWLRKPAVWRKSWTMQSPKFMVRFTTCQAGKVNYVTSIPLRDSMSVTERINHIISRVCLQYQCWQCGKIWTFYQWFVKILRRQFCYGTCVIINRAQEQALFVCSHCREGISYRTFMLDQEPGQQNIWLQMHGMSCRPSCGRLHDATSNT